MLGPHLRPVDSDSLGDRTQQAACEQAGQLVPMPAQVQGLELLCQAIVHTTPTCMCASAVRLFEVFFLSGNDSHFALHRSFQPGAAVGSGRLALGGASGPEQGV